MELERIKSSTNKDEEIRATARKILNYLANHPDLYKVHTFKPKMLARVKELEVSDDIRILATALDY